MNVVNKMYIGHMTR